MNLKGEHIKQGFLFLLISGWGIFVFRKSFDFTEFEYFLIGLYDIIDAGSIFRHFHILGRYLWSLINLFVLLVSSLALGATIIKIWRIVLTSFLEKFVITLGLGLVFWSYLTFVLGLLGLLQSHLFKFLLWGGFAFSFWFFLRYYGLTAIKSLHISGRFILPDSFISWFAIGLMLFVLLLNIICALSPEIHYDVLMYHLTLPGFYQLQGKIIDYPFNFCSYFPQNMEMLYLLSLIINSDTVAKLLHLFLGLGSVLIVYNIGRTFFSKKLAIVAAAGFYLIPEVAFQSWSALNDLGITFYVLLHIWCILKALERNHDAHKYLYLAALFSGFALGIKYTSVIIVVVSLCFILFMYGYRWKEWRKAFLLLLRYAAIVVLMVLPWLMRNAAFTGSPFAPFTPGVQQGTTGLDVRKELFLDACSRFKNFNLKDFWFTPWLNTLRKESLDSFTGPLFIFFAPFSMLLVFDRKERNLLLLLIYFFMYFILWRSQTSVWRYALPALPLLNIGMAYFMYDQDISWLNRILLKILWAGFLLGNAAVVCMGFERADPVKVFLSNETKESYLSRSHFFYPFPSYPVVAYLNEHTPPESRIIFVGETRGYYCQRDFIANSPFDVPTFQKYFKAAKDARELAAKLKQDGITHILFNEQELIRQQNSYQMFDFQPRDIQLLREFWQKHTRQIYFMKSVGLYQLL